MSTKSNPFVFKSRTDAQPKGEPAGSPLIIPHSTRSEAVGLTTHDEQVVARDGALPGLATLLDPARLLGAIRPWLFEDIEKLRAIDVDYQPATSCLVLYEAEYRGNTYWMYAKAYRPGQLSKIRKVGSKSVRPTALGPSRIVLKDHYVEVRLFPLDAKLSALWHFENDDDAEVVDRLFDRSEEIKDVVFEPIGYKPEQSMIAKMSVDGHGYASVKFLSNAGFRRIWNFNRHESNFNGIKTPKRIAHSKKLRAVARHWIDGNLASEMIRDADFEIAQLDVIAAALAVVHSRAARGVPTILPVQTLEDLRAVRNTISAIAPHLLSRFDELALAASQPILSAPIDLSFIHGDFNPGHVLLAAGEATLLDFDAAAIGNRHIDLGNFMAHLERDRVRGYLSRTRVSEAQFRFLDGYGIIHAALDEKLLAAYTAVSLLKLAPYAFRARENDWPEQAKALLDLADSHLRVRTHLESKSKFGTPSAESARTEDQQTDRFLGTALDREAMERLLGNLLDKEGRSGFRLDQIDLVQNKPGRRCLVRYDLTSKSETSHSRVVLGKIRRQGLDQRTFELTRELHRDGFGPGAPDGISVPEPLGCIPELNMWVQEEVDAKSATTLLTNGTTDRLGERVAAALLKLHKKGPQVGLRHSLADEVAVLRTRLDQAADRKPEWRQRLDDLFQKFQRLAATADVVDFSPIHRDFYPDKVLLSKGATYIVDLNLYTMGDRTLDVGNFIAHVRELSLRSTDDLWSFERVVEEFRDAYQEGAGVSVGHNIHVYSWLSMARHIWVSTRMADRNQFTERILESCEALDPAGGKTGELSY